MADLKISDLSAQQREVFQRAKGAMDSQNYGYVITLMKPMLKVLPTFLEGRQLLRAASIQQFEALSKMKKSMIGVSVAAAAMGLNKKDPAEAMAACEEVLTVDPFHKAANTKLADAARQLETLETAALAHLTVKQGHPKDTANMHTLAQLYMEMGQPQKAEQMYDEIVKVNPADGEAVSGAKNASAARTSMEGRWDTAEDYRGILKDEAASIEMEQASKVQKSEEAIQEQIASLNADLEKQPENLVVMRKIAQLYEQSEDFDMAGQWYFYTWDQGGRADGAIEKKYDEMGFKRIETRMAELRPFLDQEEWATEYNQLEAERGQKKLEVAQRRVERYPNDYQYHFELGEAFYENGDYKEALRPLQTGMKQPAVRSRAQMLIGLCHMQRGMLDMAQKTLEAAKSELPTMDDSKKEIAYHLGKVLLDRGEKEAGINEMKEIYEVDMGYMDVAEIVESSYENGDA